MVSYIYQAEKQLVLELTCAIAIIPSILEKYIPNQQMCSKKQKATVFDL